MVYFQQAANGKKDVKKPRMKDLGPFFICLDSFAHREIFSGIEFVWDPIKSLPDAVETVLDKITPKVKWIASMEGLRTQELATSDPRKRVRGILVDRWLELRSEVYFETMGVYIGKGTVLEPTAIIKGPAVIGDECEIRQGAYLRGNVIVGDHCVVGHATEIKNSVLMDHTETGHFNYIGDSILGSHVNLGAGTKLANLQFRSVKEKQEGFINPIRIPINGEDVDTGMEKMGAILGDYVEMGCNSVTCPGALVGSNNWIYPNMTLPKGYYAPGSFISPQERKLRVQNK